MRYGPVQAKWPEAQTSAAAGKALTDGNKGDRISARENDWNSATFHTEAKFERHAANHMAEFGYQSKEAYLAGARNLLSRPLSDSVEGFTGKDGFVFKYDLESNALAIGHPGGSISTYFKPIEGRKYWNDQIRKYKP